MGRVHVEEQILDEVAKFYILVIRVKHEEINDGGDEEKENTEGNRNRKIRRRV
jgi:hypothetical protein